MDIISVEQAKRYLDLLGEGEQFTFQTFDDSVMKRRALARVMHGTLDEHAEQLIRLNELGAGVFVMVNEGDGVIKDGNETCRTNANVIRVRAQFLDLDGSPLAPVIGLEARPTMIIESSPGRWHVYWRTLDTVLSEFSVNQTVLAMKFRGDPAVKDLARVMRLPGFMHQKAKPFMTRIVAPT